MLLKQIFRTLAGAQKRAAFENAHRNQRRDNVNFRWYVVRCDESGKPDGLPFDSKRTYTFRLERSLSNHTSDPRTLTA